MRTALATAFIAFCLCTVNAAHGQTDHPQEVGSPAARKIAKSHKVFLGMGKVPTNEVGQMFYDALAASLQKSNGYELVDKPTDAELQLVFSIYFAEVELTLYDPASGVPIWTFNEVIPGLHGGNVNYIWSGNYDKFAAKLSEDLKKLTK